MLGLTEAVTRLLPSLRSRIDSFGGLPGASSFLLRAGARVKSAIYVSGPQRLQDYLTSLLPSRSRWISSWISQRERRTSITLCTEKRGFWIETLPAVRSMESIRSETKAKGRRERNRERERDCNASRVNDLEGTRVSQGNGLGFRHRETWKAREGRKDQAVSRPLGFPRLRRLFKSS